MNPNSSPFYRESYLRTAFAIGFSLSGFSALIYQVAWQRVLTQSIGSDAISAVLIVTIFMVALGIGAEIARHILLRPNMNVIKAYVGIEIFIGVYGFFSVTLLRIVNNWAINFNVDSVLLDSVINFFTLAPPIIGMGMTTPLIIQIAKRQLTNLGKTTGFFYGLNILGAAIGALVTGLVLIESVGLQGTTWVAAFINVSIGIALFLKFSNHPLYTEQHVYSASSPSLSNSVILAAILFGFGTLALQIIFFRILSNYFTLSVVVFPIVLCSYLILMSIGQWVGGWLADRYAGRLQQVLVSLTVLGALLLLAALYFPPSFAAYLRAISFTTFNGSLIQESYPYLIGDPSPITVFLFSSFFMISVVALAALFPVMLRLMTDQISEAANRFASLYIFYTIGNVAGVFLCGLFILPFLGTGGSAGLTIIVVAFGSLLIAHNSPRSLMLVSICFIAAMLVPFDYYKSFKLGAYKVTQVFEGQTGVATVIPTQKFYSIIDMNRTASASAIVRDPGENDQYEAWRWNHSELMALDPSFRPRNVLIIGLGHAYLIDALLDIPSIEKITVVDLSQEVYLAVKKNTQTSTQRIFTDPRVNIIIADGRRFVQKALAKGEHFDLIQNKINEPWHVGSGNLFTVEFLLSLKALLTPGGYLGVRPLKGHLKDGLAVFGNALWPGYYHLYFKNGELNIPTIAHVTPDIRPLWFRALPGKSKETPREQNLKVIYFKNKDVVNHIDYNTDDKPTFEYYWLRQTLDKWTSPREPVEKLANQSSIVTIPVVID